MSFLAMKPKPYAKANTENVLNLNSDVTMANVFLRGGVAIMKTVIGDFLEY